MDALDKSDLEISRETPPAEKLKQAFELMELGFKIKRAALVHQRPEATPAEIEAAFEAWLFSDI